MRDPRRHTRIDGPTREGHRRGVAEHARRHARVAVDAHRLSSIVLPTDGLLLVSYYARFQFTQSGGTGIGAGAALDVNGQIQGAPAGVFGPLEGQTSSMGGTLTPSATRAGEATMSTAGPGLSQGSEGSAISGSLPSAGMRLGGLAAFELAAGTYNVEVKWRRFSGPTSSGTVQDGRLRVVTLGF